MKCRNCGAELNGQHVCEYCGTKYNYISNNGDGTYYLEYGGHLLKVYLAKMQTETIESVAIDVDGVPCKMTHDIRRFEFVTID